MDFGLPSGRPDGAPCSHAEVEAEWPKGLRVFQAGPIPVENQRINGNTPENEVEFRAEKLWLSLWLCALLLRDYVQTKKSAEMLSCCVSRCCVIANLVFEISKSKIWGLKSVSHLCRCL